MAKFLEHRPPTDANIKATMLKSNIYAVQWTHSRDRWAQVAVELIDAAYPEIVGRWPAGRPASDSYPICWLWPSMPRTSMS
jgi:hypothetical protein